MGNHPPNTVSASTTSNNKSTETSSTCFRFHLRWVARTLHSKSNGAMTKSPEASPSHHVSQIGQEFDHCAKPPTARLPTPKVGLTVVLMSTASANLKTSCGRSNTRAPPANRVTSHAPQIASKVFPLAMPSDVKLFPTVVRFTKNAPTKIAGHTRNPRTSNAASAIPAGG